MIDSVLIMLCLPDSNPLKVVSLMFEPISHQVKQLICHKVNIQPEPLIKNILKCLPQLETLLSEYLDGIPKSSSSQAQIGLDIMN